MRISGTVSSTPDAPVARVEVVAFEKDLRSEHEIGRARTSGDGRYAIEYAREGLQRVGKGSVNVFVEVRPQRRGRAVRSPVRYGAPESLVVDLVLDDEFF